MREQLPPKSNNVKAMIAVGLSGLALTGCGKEEHYVDTRIHTPQPEPSLTSKQKQQQQKVDQAYYKNLRRERRIERQKLNRSIDREFNPVLNSDISNDKKIKFLAQAICKRVELVSYPGTPWQLESYKLNAKGEDMLTRVVTEYDKLETGQQSLTDFDREIHESCPSKYKAVQQPYNHPNS